MIVLRSRCSTAEEVVMAEVPQRRGLSALDLPGLRWPSWFNSLPEFRMPEFPDLESLIDREGMRLEEHREGDELVVRAEMPGIDPDNDVEITVSDHTLYLSAQRREEKKDEDGYRSEFRYGKFTRMVPLPAGATQEDVKASYSDGILEVRIPVAEELAEGRKIPITRPSE
jgi:HSP20 family protein